MQCIERDISARLTATRSALCLCLTQKLISRWTSLLCNIVSYSSMSTEPSLDDYEFFAKTSFVSRKLLQSPGQLVNFKRFHPKPKAMRGAD